MSEIKRRLVVELTERSREVLSRICDDEEINKTTAVNRAIQVYDQIMQAQAAGRTVIIGEQVVRFI